MSIKGDRNRLKGSELKKFGESKLWANLEIEHERLKKVIKTTFKVRKVEK